MDVSSWLASHSFSHEAQITVSFVVTADGLLRIAERHSEHVVCAGGQPVLSAGEMTFAQAPKSLEVVFVSNQSTGYCPEPESWEAVSDALERAGFEPRAGFDFECQFRRCETCQTINIVKDGAFVCSVCDGELALTYNVT